MAIGPLSMAGRQGIQDYKEVRLGYNEQPYFKTLQLQYPELYGEFKEEEKYSKERTERVGRIIFTQYEKFFKSQGINSYDELKEKDVAMYDPILSKLGWQYALTRDNVQAPVAIGVGAEALGNYAWANGYVAQAHADNAIAVGRQSYVNKINGVAIGVGAKVLADSGVALGAYSEVNTKLEDFAGEGKEAPFSKAVLSTTGNANKEYLLGPVFVGGTRYVNKDASGTYLRQIKAVADGTDDTDAINLRQLKKALENAGSGSHSDNGANNNGGNSDNNGGNSGNNTLVVEYEAGENVVITDKDGSGTIKTIAVPGLTDIKTSVRDMGDRVTNIESDVVALNNTVVKMDQRINNLDRRVDKVGAGAAALAALHPLDYDPDNKWDIAAGIGHYSGQSAVALGAYYRPGEDVMISIGGAFGNGENMVNAGVSVKVGSGESSKNTSKSVMAKKLASLETVVAEQRVALDEQRQYRAEQDRKIQAQEEELQELRSIVQALEKKILI